MVGTERPRPSPLQASADTKIKAIEDEIEAASSARNKAEAAKRKASVARAS
jgi:hypothetical protein